MDETVVVWTSGPRFKPETAWQRGLRYNLYAAAWLVIVGGLMRFGLYAADPIGTWYRWAPFEARAVMAPLLLSGFEFFLWLRFYRHGGREARGAALAAGICLSIIVLVQLLRASIDVPISVWGTLLVLYFALSHLAYAVFGTSMRE